MARYVDEYQGIYGRGVHGGRDPNYQGGYYGMRMHAGRGQAAYGDYRFQHRHDLGGGNGGFAGRYEQEYGYGREYQAGRGRGPGRAGGYDAALLREGGGVRDPRYDREYLRDFNAHSPALHRGQGGYGGGYDRAYSAEGGWSQRGGHPAFEQREGYRQEYGNRGLSSSGYAQPWVGSPRHGGR